MKNFFGKVKKILSRIVLYFFIISILSVIIFRFVPVPFTPLMVIRNVERIAHGKSFRLKKEWTPIKKISKNMQLAVICSEDQNFTSHHGFDFHAINKAIKHNKRSRHKKGASTISQQTAKNLFLFPDRTWVRKGLEVYFTALIELFWPKERIMEVYLNIIELGDGIYGVEAASQYYFTKSAKNLTRSQASLLAVVLPNPIKYSAMYPNAYIRRRQHWVMHQMTLFGPITYDKPMFKLEEDEE
ncbi:MAG: monofunctional biosynthetic peptidoglycan transglycosylase [Bacteroidota bacterium]|nr:monofunctional biosynthetic peptidoglycan transglycosylase [Bacteroidota bacterium]MDP4225993.1 monofunctional biosynthetic peptidoglycan transglycosylase [Bacteroidota bacterium]MDP4272832.1 monofunctional biosynthetic peptidoglycan transglycosylase [Bacteroidota bacterium]